MHCYDVVDSNANLNVVQIQMAGFLNFLASVGRINALIGMYVGYLAAAILAVGLPIYAIARYAQKKKEEKPPIMTSVVLPILFFLLGAFLVLFLTQLSYTMSMKSKPWAAMGGGLTILDAATVPFRNT